jgi:hypothetical protein
MSKEQRADVAKKQFIVREVLIFGGLSSLLGIFSVYQRHFGWHLGLDFLFRCSWTRCAHVLDRVLVFDGVMDVVTNLAST